MPVQKKPINIILLSLLIVVFGGVIFTFKYLQSNVASRYVEVMDTREYQAVLNEVSTELEVLEDMLGLLLGETKNTKISPFLKGRFERLSTLREELLTIQSRGQISLDGKQLEEISANLELFISKGNKLLITANVNDPSVQFEMIDMRGEIDEIVSKIRPTIDTLNKEADILLAKAQKPQGIGLNTYFNITMTVLIIALLLMLFALVRMTRAVDKSQRLANELALLNENKNKFFSVISHDLKGSVDSIHKLSEFLLSYDQNIILTGEIAGHLNKSALKLRQLLENLLSWSRMQMNHIEFNPENVDLYTLGNSVKDVLEEVAREKEIQLTTKIPQPFEVNGDVQMIRTVLRNLVNNAIKFTNDGGTVEIIAEKGRDHWSVFVIDNGIGMPEEVKTNLFRIDKPISTKDTRDESGSGLGLILCQEFVQKHGGEIQIDSIENKGTTVAVTIPYELKAEGE